LIVSGHMAAPPGRSGRGARFLLPTMEDSMKSASTSRSRTRARPPRRPSPRRPQVEWLEDRLQPGSVLTTAAAFSLLGGGLASLDEDPLSRGAAVSDALAQDPLARRCLRCKGGEVRGRKGGAVTPPPSSLRSDRPPFSPCSARTLRAGLGAYGVARL